MAYAIRTTLYLTSDPMKAMKFLLKMKIVKMKHKDVLTVYGKEKKPFYKLNPFNPLTYVLILLFMPIDMIKTGAIQSIKDLISAFKYKH